MCTMHLVSSGHSNLHLYILIANTLCIRMFTFCLVLLDKIKERAYRLIQHCQLAYEHQK